MPLRHLDHAVISDLTRDRLDAKFPPVEFQFLCSYLLYPFAMMMGVELEDCRKVGKLIGNYDHNRY